MPKLIIPASAILFVAIQFLPISANVEQWRGGNLAIVNVAEYQGKDFTCDLPAYEHIKNIGGTDRAGMCVLSSIEMAAIYQCMEDYRGVRDYWAKRERGGGWPGRMDDQIPRYAKAKGIQTPPYLQVETRDPAKVKQVCELAFKTGRMIGMTYGWSPRYGNKIAHMVCGVSFNNEFAVVLDNNFPGTYEVCRQDEFVRRMMYTDGSAWIFVWLTSPPPPAPKN